MRAWLAGVAFLTGCTGAAEQGGEVPPGIDAAPPDAAPLVPDTSRKICDGSDGLRFAYRVGGGFGSAGVEYELGSDFLFVDGHCRYWASPLDFEQRGLFRTGVLDTAGEQQLADGTFFQSWATLAEGFRCTEMPPLDGSSGSFSDGTLLVRCPYCESDARPELEAACGAIVSLPGQLWSAGAALDGPVRLRLYASAGPPDQEYDWPLATEPTVVGEADLDVTDPADAAALRTLRLRHDSDFPGDAGIYVPVRTAGGALHRPYARRAALRERRAPGGLLIGAAPYVLRIRDVLPFGTNGYVDF